MESTKASNINLDDKIPKERRIRTKETEGKLDDDGFFRTPNGSFWDMDGEYFNHYGFDIHGGKYINELDYIPGPTWIEDLGCYPEDEEKYRNEGINDMDYDNDIDIDNDLDILEAENEINIHDLGKLDINKGDKKDGILNENEIKKDKNNKKGKKNKKKKKEESFDEDEWEEIED